MQQQNESQIIKTIGENGEELTMRLQEIVTVEGKDYALLSLVDEEKQEVQQDNDELVLMKMNKTEQECTFEVIEDDEEFNFVARAITEEDDSDDEEE